MTSAKPKLPKILRWLSPLLLVSLGLHGLGLLLPVPDKPEEIERAEFVAPDSIQVSTLPPTLEPEPEPEPPPPPPPVVEPPPPVAELPPLQEAFPFQEEWPEEEPVEEEPVEEEPADEDDDSSFDDPDDDETSDDDDTSDDDSPVRSPYNAQGTSRNDSAIKALEFSTRYPGVAVSTQIPLALTFIADKCFEPLPGVVELGVAINSSGGVVEASLFRQSGYEDIDLWIEDLAGFGDDLPPEAFAGLDISAGSFSDWINETRRNQLEPLAPSGGTAKAYAVQVMITVEGNRCE